ncbi:MAG: acyl-ACP--UDP-N- acetylglucosamine O-acyltransferase [Campylobacterota bacterium]|nr:acyl-ACP--UDP-N- acetylglucosamine O-acyltransferase [Campylobacterota bacterium]
MIHPTALIDPAASVADDVTIGPFCQIGKNVIIEKGAVLQAHVIITGPVTLKENVRLFSFVKIGNGNASISVGENSHIREFSQIGNQNETSSSIEIGRDNFIMAYVQLYPGVTLGDACILTNTVTLLEDVTCEERVIVGGLTTIEAGNTIGTGVMIGGASYITHDMPPYCLVEGNRATIKGLNNIGLRRLLDNREDIKAIKAAFIKIFRNTVDKEMAKELAEQSDNLYVTRLASFAATSNI